MDFEDRSDAEMWTKFASESNIADALVMMEPGLRKIPKDVYFTTSEEETYDYEEERIEDESGFFSFSHHQTPNLPQVGTKLASHVTVIAINHNPIYEDEAEEIKDEAENVFQADRVTVNGRHIVSSQHENDDNETDDKVFTQLA